MKRSILSIFILWSTAVIHAQTPILHTSADTICINHVITFSDSTITPRPSTYQWIFTGGTIYNCSGCVISGDTATLVLSDTLTPFPPSISVGYHISSTPNGCFPVTETITNSNGSNSVQKCVTVLPGPHVTYTLQKDTTVASTWNIHPAYTNFFPADSMKWTWGDGTSTTVFFPSHTYAAPGWYNICVYAYSRFGCAGSYCMNDTIFRTDANSSLVHVNVIDPASGIASIDHDQKLDLFPNPAQNSFVVRTTNGGMQKLNLYNSEGSLVMHKTFYREETFDVSQLPGGIYTATIFSNNLVVTKKFVLIR